MSMTGRGGYRPAGFTLVGLVVTLTILATVSGVAGFYYMQVLDDRKISVAKNELDAIAKHVRAYLVSRGYPELTTTTLDFLLEGGALVAEKIDGRALIVDPWGREYKIDPVAGVVYSEGPEENVDLTSLVDDIRMPYRRTVDIRSLEAKDYQEDTVPPVILANAPTGIIRINNPVVRASFVDHYGGVIDPSSVRMWIDAADVETAGGVVTKSAGQIIFTTAGTYGDGKYKVVVQVQDGAGNVARREWSFEVDTQPAVVKILTPTQGDLYAGSFAITYSLHENNCKRWWLDWDQVTIREGSFATPTLLDIPLGTENIDPTAASPHVSNKIGPENVADGIHYMTLRVEDGTGRIYSDQVEVILDNTAPTVYITQFPPDAPGDPPVLTTFIPIYKGWADDSLQVRTVEFQYVNQGNGVKTPDPASQGGVEGTTAAPIDYVGNPTGNWMALYNSASEEWSTTGTPLAVSAGGFVDTTLPMGQFEIQVWAYDLAGNKSAVASDVFIVDLLAGGITDQKFVDKTYPGGTVHEPYRTISSLSQLMIDAMYDTSWAKRVQRSGSVSFRCKQSSPISVWEAVIDDYSTAATHAASDGVFMSFYPVGSTPFDWTSTGANDQATPIVRAAELYVPDGDNNGVTYDVRRNGDPDALEEGVYRVRCSYYNIAGPPRTVYTTFAVDNTVPQIDKVIWMRPDGMRVAFNEGDPPITGYSNVLPGSYQIHFGGQASDGPPGIGRIAYVWFGKRPASDTAVTTSQVSIAYPNRIDGWLSHPAVTPCSFGINLYGVGAASETFASNKMVLSATQPWLLDGQHRIFMVAEDGAGLTTTVYRTVTVNCVGPAVEYCRFDNVEDTPQITYATTSTVIEVAERRLDLNFLVRDEVPLTNVYYRITERTAPKPSPVPLGVTGAPLSQVYDLILINDSYGSEFKSSPTSYELEIWGVSGAVEGLRLKVNIEFKFLMGFAIVAPNYGLDDSGVRTVGAAEQTAVAEYLYNNVTAVQNAVLYNRNGPVKSWGFPGAPPGIAEWLSTHTTSSTTDVLVVLDQAVQNMGFLKSFLKSDLDVDGTTDPNPDADVVVVMGQYPSSSWLDPAGVRQYSAWGSDESDWRRAFDDLLEFEPSDHDNSDWRPDDVGWGTAYQRLYPFVGDGPQGDFYLPSLQNHGTGDFGLADGWRFGRIHSEGDWLGENAGWSDWKMERLFTIRSDGPGSDDKLDSGNFVIRNQAVGSRFAMFFSYLPVVPLTPHDYTSSDIPKNVELGNSGQAKADFDVADVYSVAKVEVFLNYSVTADVFNLWIGHEASSFQMNDAWQSGYVRLRKIGGASGTSLSGWYGVDLTPDDATALSVLNGKAAASKWVLKIEKSATGGPATIDISSCTLRLYSGTGSEYLDNVRPPVWPAPYVLEEFIQNWLLNKGKPDVGAKRVVYDADRSHRDNAENTSGNNERDVYYTPTAGGGWYNVSQPDGRDCYAGGITADASRIALVTRQYDSVFSTTTGRSLYFWQNGLMSRVHEADAGDGSDDDGLLSQGAIDMARQGDVIFTSKATHTAPTTNKLTSRVAYHLNNNSGAVSKITTALPAGADAYNPRISANGKFMTVSTRMRYDGTNVDPTFPTPVLTAESQIWRYRTDVVVGTRYAGGWVTKNLNPGTIHPAAGPWKCEDGLITDDGKAVIFSATWSGQTTSNIAFGLEQGGFWYCGFITKIGAEWAGGPGRVAILPQAMGVLPPTIFWTTADLNGQVPDAGNLWDVGFPSQASTCIGTDAASGDDTPRLMLFYDVKQPLLELLRLPSAGTPGTVEWSTDGRELVVTAKSRSLEYRSGNTFIRMPRDGSDWDDRWRVYRVRVGAPWLGEGTNLVVTPSTVAPKLAEDYGNEDNQPSKGPNAFIAR